MYDNESPLQLKSVSPAPANTAAAADTIFAALTLSEARYINGDGDPTARTAAIKAAWPGLDAAAVLANVTARVKAAPPPDAE